MYERLLCLIPPPTYISDHKQDPDEPDDARAWDLHSSFSVSWDAGDDSDASEPSDQSGGYITFTRQPTSMPREPESGFRQFDLLEPSVFALDFPEDVGELVEPDAVPADGDSGVHVIGRLGGLTSTSASEIPFELSVQAPEDFPDPPVCVPDILLPPMRESSVDGDEHKSFTHLRYLGSNVQDVPINVPLSPLVLMIDGFPDDTSPQYSDLVVLT
jgi:hypothetical protein